MQKITRLFSLLLLAFFALGAGAQEQFSKTYSSDNPVGKFYRYTTAGWEESTASYTRRWQSNDELDVSITMSANNMRGSDFSFWSGIVASPNTITMTTDWVITGISITFINVNNDGEHNQTITIQDEVSATAEGTEPATVELIDIDNLREVSFTVTGTNTGAALKALTIYYIENPERALDHLNEVITQNPFDETLYPAGTEGGYYPQDLVTAAQQAYDDAVDMQINGGTAEEYNEAADTYLAALAALKAGQIQIVVTPGNYFILNARSEYAGSVIEDLTLDNDLDGLWAEAGNRLYYKSHVQAVQDETADPSTIWALEQATDSTFYIKSVCFNKYVVSVTSSGYYIGLSDDVANAGEFKFITSPTHAGWVMIRNNAVPTLFGYAEDVAFLFASTYSGYPVTILTGAEFASQWKLVSVSDATMELMQEKIQETLDSIAQARMNDKLSELYVTAAEAEQAGKTYISDGTYDGKFPVTSETATVVDEETGEESEVTTVTPDGIITSASQLYSNIQDSGEGTYEGLFDGVYNGSSFFHTSWHSSQAEVAQEPHYLQIALNQDVETLLLKYAVRSNAGSADWPYIVNIYATNDASKLSGVETTQVNEESGEEETVVSEVPSTEWDSIGQVFFTYDYQPIDAEGNAVTISYSNTNNPVVKGAGVSVLELGKAYKYVRLSVIETVQSYKNGSKRTNGDGYNYWNLSELRGYTATYDNECVYEVVDKDARKALQDQLAAAEAELNEGKATQETYDALEAAYDAFMAVYPDAAKLQDAIADAQSYVDAAGEPSTEPGYYPEGAKEALAAIIAEATTVAGTKPFTFAIYNGALQSLSDGVEAFVAKLNRIESGLYRIKSVTTGAAANAFVYAANSSLTKDGNASLSWGYADDSELDNRANLLWKVTKLENGKYTIQNVTTGYYIGTDQTTLSGRVGQSEEPSEISLGSARSEGAFNMLLNDTLNYFANAEPGSAQRLVVWNNSNGADNSAFVFESADFQYTQIVDITADAVIYTLPIAISTPSDVVAYEVKGLDEPGENLVLSAIEESEIAAGVPFVVMEDHSTVPSFSAYFMASDIETIEYATEGAAAGALVGVLQPTEVTKELTFSEDGTEVVPAEGVTIAANRGFISAGLLLEGERVAAQTKLKAGSVVLIPLSESAKELLTGINELEAQPATKAAAQGVYTLTGVRVANAKRLPAGIYIIGGKKVLVK